MGIFSIFSKNKNSASSSTPNASIKEPISLEKCKINLDKSVVSLSKTTGVDFSTITSRVMLVLDYSGSMEHLYNSGKVQDVVTRLFPLALKFDDDGKLDCLLFSNNFCSLPVCTKSNVSNYITKFTRSASLQMCGTHYYEPLYHLHSMNCKKANNKYPQFVIFITDGENSDQLKTDTLLREMCEDDCFIMFIGIGSENFKYLSKLDSLSGRSVDNTGFVKFEDIFNIPDEQLYVTILTEYSSWLSNWHKTS